MIRTPAVKKPSVNYVDNAEFYREMVDFKSDPVNIDRVAKGLRPNIPNSIGKKILDINTHLAFKYNFISYSFREDMVSDGIQNCINYIWNFDPTKSKNPFGFYSLISFRAFVRRIQKEKKLYSDKKKYIDFLKIEMQEEPMDCEMTKGIAADINKSIFGWEHDTRATQVSNE